MGHKATLASALTAPYLVFDETGTLVAWGSAGDAGVELEEGVYRVEVLSDPPRTFEAVEVDVTGTVELPLGNTAG